MYNEAVFDDGDITDMFSRKHNHQGFTLIELMIVVVIIAILAAIAVPSYRQYVIRNAELETQAQMKQLEIELQRWRATALTYKNFVPKKEIDSNGDVVYGYDKDDMIIYIPKGSSATNYRYQIRLVDGTDTTKSLVSNKVVDNIAGRSWRMIAEPNTNYSTAKKILLGSNGLQCKTKSDDTSITVASSDCGSYSEEW